MYRSGLRNERENLALSGTGARVVSEVPRSAASSDLPTLSGVANDYANSGWVIRSGAGEGPRPGTSAAAAPVSAASLAHALALVGLSSREARMYLALVRAPLGAREASELAGLPRATGYRVLLRLIDRGMVVGNRRIPQSFQSVPPRLLFHRLELAHRFEAEVAAILGETLAREVERRPGEISGPAGYGETPRLLCGAFRTNHPALAELAAARTSAAIVVPPLATPPSYRHALARTVGRLAHQGVHLRLITDALPGDYRFAQNLRREAGGTATAIEVRHVGPLGTHLYAIDRHRVALLPVLGASHRRPPVGLLVTDVAQVRSQMSRFEALWSGASGAIEAPRRTRELVARARIEPAGVAHYGAPASV